MIEALERLPDAVQDDLRETDPPRWTAPMLATLTDERFSDADWLYERKLDGERCLGFRTGSDVRLRSRNREDLSPTYPELMDALEGQSPTPFILDGEVVAFSKGVSSFSRLQQRLQIDDPAEARKSNVAVYYYVFDLLHLDGYDLTKIDLRYRKSVLKAALSYDDPLRFTSHRNEAGEAFFEEACDKGWEGVIAKKVDSPYVHSRSKNWLKFKCVRRQELVIGGFTEPEGERIGFGALLLGVYDGDELVYAGKVGTGFDDETLRSLRSRLDLLERETPPFDRGDLPRKEVHWVTPKLVAQIGFEEWTDDDRLRQPRFLGLRHDKDPHNVIKETPKAR